MQAWIFSVCGNGSSYAFFIPVLLAALTSLYIGSEYGGTITAEYKNGRLQICIDFL
jgi:hypothetical protein